MPRVPRAGAVYHMLTIRWRGCGCAVRVTAPPPPWFDAGPRSVLLPPSGASSLSGHRITLALPPLSDPEPDCVETGAGRGPDTLPNRQDGPLDPPVRQTLLPGTYIGSRRHPATTSCDNCGSDASTAARPRSGRRRAGPSRSTCPRSGEVSRSRALCERSSRSRARRSSPCERCTPPRSRAGAAAQRSRPAEAAHRHAAVRRQSPQGNRARRRR